MLELIKPFIEYIVVGIVLLLGWLGNNKHQQSKGKKEAEQKAMEESFKRQAKRMEINKDVDQMSESELDDAGSKWLPDDSK